MDRVRGFRGLAQFFRMALIAGVTEAVQLHIVRGDDINASDNFGMTPLMLAAQFNMPEICALLVEAGADPTMCDREGRTAYDLTSPEHLKTRQLLESAHKSQIRETDSSLNRNDSLHRNPDSVSVVVDVLHADLEEELAALSWVSDETPSPLHIDPVLSNAAGQIQRDITAHIPEKLGQEWYSETDTPVAFLLEEDDSETRSLRDLLRSSIRRGFVLTDELETFSVQMKCPDAAFVMSVLTNAMADLEVDLVTPNTVEMEQFAALDSPSTRSDNWEESYEFDLLNEACHWIESTVSGCWVPSRMFLRDIQAHDLLTAEEEVQIGQRMESAIESALEVLSQWPQGIASTAALGRAVVAGTRPMSSFSQSVEENESNRSESNLRVDEDNLEGTGSSENISLKNTLSINPSFQSLVESLANSVDDAPTQKCALLPTIEALSLNRAFLLELHTLHENDDSDGYASFDVAIKAYLKARDQLVSANLRLAQHISRKYLPSGEPIDDLAQAGNLGLLKAADKYDWRKGFKFSTYATWWIRQSISRYIADNARTIRIPVHIHDKLKLYSRELQFFEWQEGRAPSDAEMEVRLKLTPKMIKLLHSLTGEMHSIDESPMDEVEALRIEESDLDHPEGRLMANQLKDLIDELLKGQNRMYANVIRLRYGLGLGFNFTLDEIGSRHEVTREYIRQIERKVISALQKKPELQLLRQILHGKDPDSISQRKYRTAAEPTN